MLESIRTDLMKRQYDKLLEMSGVGDNICPRIRKVLESNKFKSRHCVTKPAVGEKFQVTCDEDQFVVDLRNRTCTCRHWDITGIPCIHACSSIHFLHKDPADYVHEWYSVERYLKVYSTALEPLNGNKLWPSASGYPIKPSPFRKMPGRPKKKRRRAHEEERQSATKLKRFGLQMTCQNCLKKRHNKKTCKNEPVEKPKKKKRGRPKKLVDSSDAPSFQKRPKVPVERPKLPVKRKVNSIVQKERAMARKGIGLLQSEETGNNYLRMSSHKKVHLIPSNDVTSAGASSSERMSTIEMGADSGTRSLVECENNIGTQSSAI